MRKLKQIRNVGGYAHINPNKGITLVALVITIIVLLILAGITINLTVGQRGILIRAREAGRNYQEAGKKEDEDLAKFLGEADNIIAGTGGSILEKPWEQDPSNPEWSKPSTNTKKNNYEDESGNTATIPEGFQVSKKEGETEISEGLVIRDATTQNEYVWVPCSEDGVSGIKYDRCAFLADQPTDGIDEVTNSTKIKYSSSSSYYNTEAMSSEELNSIKKYGGFYIGRYEVGIVGYDDNVVTTNSSSLTNWTGYSNGTAVVQKGKQVWNYITRDKAKEIAEEMYKNNDAVISKLCSSYAWDTTLKFIEMNYPDYATNSTQGNYSNTTFEYTDLNGNVQIKTNGSKVLVPTGETTSVNNVYDMGGNAWEWTTEGCSRVSNPYTVRGGGFDYGVNYYPAGYRSSDPTTSANIQLAFRQTLYVQ